jgi:signal transduction histidine kinase
MKSESEIAHRVPVWQAPSLRGRIALLTASVVILLTITLCVLFWVLRSTQANVVHRSQRHLEAVARSLANAYQARTDHTALLANVEPTPHEPIPDEALQDSPPLPPPPPFRPGMHPTSAENRILEAITAKVLQNETGIEGGFFRLSDQQLVGYSFPTHEGPGDPKALPARETPDIVDVASAAALGRDLQQHLFYGPHDVVLFIAVPVCDQRECAGKPLGAAWLMQRLPGAESDRKRAILWSAFGFGLIACITVSLAFVALQQVSRGTDAILDRLKWMESNLEGQDRLKSVRLAEFHRVLDGLDLLGDTLRTQMERERDLQVRVRQSERLAAIGQLAAGVAHELRNPLATIRLRAQMAQRKSNEDATTQSSSVILKEVDRLDAMIERLLDLSRPIRLNLTKVDISELAGTAVQRWMARSPDISMEYVGPDGLCVSMDAMRLEQVLDNLIENAVLQLAERKPLNPVIRVDCGERDDDMFLTVQDNGGGFTNAALENGLQPFFTTRAKGTGLGLAITQEIVHAFGGTLDLSNLSDGALVSIQFPRSGPC